METGRLRDVDAPGEEGLEILRETDLVECGGSGIEIYEKVEVALRGRGAPPNRAEDAGAPGSVLPKQSTELVVVRAEDVGDPEPPPTTDLP